MKHISVYLTLALLAASAGSPAQTISSSAAPSGVPAASTLLSRPATSTSAATPAPFSRLAFGGGISLMGINLQAAVNANRYMNIRGVGNVFSYTVNNISTNGLNLNGKLNFATAGASVDVYPFPNHGFRISPGALFYNQNAVSADVTVAGGTSFTLNDVTYYASSAKPITGTGSLGLNTRKQAFTMTTGWGNMISRRGGHWSFPFELGAAFVGAPTVNVVLNSGQACDAQGQNCVNVATDQNVQSNLKAQIDKYKNDINPFQYYPIISFGVAYNFGIRPGSAVK